MVFLNKTNYKTVCPIQKPKFRPRKGAPEPILVDKVYN